MVNSFVSLAFKGFPLHYMNMRNFNYFACLFWTPGDCFCEEMPATLQSKVVEAALVPSLLQDLKTAECALVLRYFYCATLSSSGVLPLVQTGTAWRIDGSHGCPCLPHPWCREFVDAASREKIALLHDSWPSEAWSSVTFVGMIDVEIDVGIAGIHVETTDVEML
jgi:hypothetical protein